ncbi:uncharacterized protein LOC115994220 isoform X2 [Quercus lobata]|nr:uncharacterized protein LOC115994220 isoform X2 [Quercus lobata]
MVFMWLKVQIRIMVLKLAAANNVSTAIEGRINETVEYEMDLVDSALKSLRSLSNERWERQHDRLSKVVSAFGYQKKVPDHIHQENVAKLASLMQEILSLKEASLHIEAQANKHD